MNNQRIQKDIENLKSEYNSVSLSFAEKENIKANIFEKINSIPVATPSPFFSWSFYARVSSLALAAFVLVTSPVVVAAQRSLPGELLYPVKTNINEGFVEIFIPEEEKSEYQRNLLTKRAYEIKKVSEKGELSKEEIEDAESAIEISFSKIIDDDLKKEKDKDAIKGHQEVIAVLGFAEKIINEKKPKDFEGKLDDFKLVAQTHLNNRIAKISDDSLEEIIEDTKAIIEEISEEEKEDFSDVVERIDNDNDIEIKTQTENREDGEEPEEENHEDEKSFSVETRDADFEDRLDMALDLQEELIEKKIQIEIDMLSK